MNGVMTPITKDEFKPNTVYVTKLNETFMTVNGDEEVKTLISERFSFTVKHARFMKGKRQWDGVIKLYNKLTKKMYLGLIYELARFCRECDLKIVGDVILPQLEISKDDVVDFVDALDTKLDKRDYQIDSIHWLLKNGRGTLLSPTASGKSLIIYAVSQFYKGRTLIVINRIGLGLQMVKDIQSYGYKGSIYTLMDGADPNTNANIVVGTWHTIVKQPPEWFEQFSVICGDECHEWKAKSFRQIIDMCTDISYRFGFTGTIDTEDTEVNSLLVQGGFGKVKQFVTTKELMDDNFVSDLKINIVIFEHQQAVKKMGWQDEVMWLCEHEKRNKYIRNLALNLNNNTLVLFNYVEKHGSILYDLIKNSTNRPIFYIHGGTKAEQREQVRQTTIESDDVIIVASYGTFSTGVNIPNLHNVIFGSPFKSRIRNLQSIGRSLRLHETKEMAVVFDLADDLCYNNKSMDWCVRRITRYAEENFEYTMHKVKL